MIVLAGDVGGTKTLLQLYDTDKNREIGSSCFESHRYTDFEPLLQDFFASLGENARRLVESVCIAVAGPVQKVRKGRAAKVTNLPWSLNSIELSAFFKGAPVYLLNDFVAVCYGIDELSAKDFLVLQQGESSHNANHKAVIGAGTGLGMAQIDWCGKHEVIFPAEGGHADFAPGSEYQAELLMYLWQKEGRVTLETVCSGRGLLNIYDFVCKVEPEKENPALRGEIENGGPAVITYFANRYHDVLAEKSLTLFVEIYGAIAGNFALTTLPFGGVYIAGGIAPKIVDWISRDTFIQAFNNKNKMSSLLAKIPVKLILNDKVGLLGSKKFSVLPDK